MRTCAEDLFVSRMDEDEIEESRIGLGEIREDKEVKKGREKY